MQIHQIVRPEQVRLAEVSALREESVEGPECCICWVPVAAGDVGFETQSGPEPDRFEAVTCIRPRCPCVDRSLAEAAPLVNQFGVVIPRPVLPPNSGSDRMP